VRGHVEDVILDQDRQVLVVDRFLLVRRRLEVVEGRLELLVGEAISKLGNAVPQRVAARVLAEDQVGLGDADVLGTHGSRKSIAP
jgi:hypothetical protein